MRLATGNGRNASPASLLQVVSLGFEHSIRLLVAASFAAAKERTTLICGIILFVMISVARNWFDPPRQLRLPDTSWPSAVVNAKSGPVEFTFPPGWKVVIPKQ